MEKSRLEKETKGHNGYCTLHTFHSSKLYKMKYKCIAHNLIQWATHVIWNNLTIFEYLFQLNEMWDIVIIKIITVIICEWWW